MNYSLILASKSPRRKEILQDLGFDVMVIYSNAKEASDPESQTLDEKVISIARKKATAVASIIDETSSNEIIIASDTVVCIKEEILGKPNDRKEAFDMLKKLSGNKHRVITATVIIDNNKALNFERASKTIVNFKPLTEKLIQEYLDQNEFLDKAGAYGIQNNGDWLVKDIQGDYFNVMGLSVTTMVEYFKKYYNVDLSTIKLLKKHESVIRKFRSDGDSNE